MRSDRAGATSPSGPRPPLRWQSGGRVDSGTRRQGAASVPTGKRERVARFFRDIHGTETTPSDAIVFGRVS